MTLIQRAAVMLFLTLATFRPVFAQGLGQVTGTITDPSGAAVAGAKVTAVERGTGQARMVNSTTEGFFTITSLRPAVYDLTVEATGFRTVSHREITLQADQSVSLNLKLEIGSVSETLLVNAQATQVDTSTSTLNEVVDQRRIVELPLNGRNAAALALITAGTVLGPATGADEGNSKTFPVSQPISANGARQNQTSYRLDGANNNDVYTNTNQPFPFPDALQEFSVQTSNYSAKYGGNAGGVVNIVTKSGVNELHGNLFEFNRNAAFNARNFFGAARDPLKRNQFGGTLGGPVVIPGIYHGKNKTFFFMGYQGTRIRNTPNGASSLFPTAAALNGDFSAYLNSTVKSINDPVTGQPFPNAFIPPTRFDPAAVALTKYMPVGTGTGLVYYGGRVIQAFDEVPIRIDHSLSDKDRLTGRYYFARFNNSPFLDTKNYVNNNNYAIIDAQNWMLNETHTFSPGLLNDFRFSVARETSDRGPAEGSINAADLGVKIYQPPQAKTIQGVNVQNFFNVAQQNPARFVRTQYTLSDGLYWTRGSHSLTFGVDANRTWVLIRNQFNQPGAWTFSADNTNLSMASYFLGYVRNFLQGNGEFKDNRVNTFGLYIQDDWRVSRRLTFNLGLRYDPFFPWKETKGRIELFKPDAYAQGLRSNIFTNAPRGLLFPGDPGIAEYGLRGTYKNFAPRLGFAYDVRGNGNWSVRGGLGMFYDSMQNGIYNNRFVDVSPFSVQVNQTPALGTFSDPYRGQVNPFPAPYPPPKNILFPSPVQVATYDPANGSQYQTPVSYGWNLTVEHQLGRDYLLRLAYVGSHASHLLESLDLSPTIYGSGGRRYFPEYSQIATASQDVNSSYNSLQVSLEKRFSQGFTLLANYTYSKSIDDLPFGQSITTVVAGQASPIPWYMAGRHQFDRGPSEFDHQHRLVTSFVWQLPSLKSSSRGVRLLAGGWQLSGLFSAQSGGPVTVEAGKDQSGTALGRDRGVLLSDNVYGGSACAATKATCVNYLNPAAFALPAAGTFGNLGKGVLRGPDMISYDGGLFKEIPLRADRLKIQFRAEFFNLFNRVNFYNPGGTVDSSRNAQSNSATQSAQVSDSLFGTIRAAFDPRIGQLALKLVF